MVTASGAALQVGTEMGNKKPQSGHRCHEGRQTQCVCAWGGAATENWARRVGLRGKGMGGGGSHLGKGTKAWRTHQDVTEGGVGERQSVRPEASRGARVPGPLLGPNPEGDGERASGTLAGEAQCQVQGVTLAAWERDGRDGDRAVLSEKGAGSGGRCLEPARLHHSPAV